MAEGEKRRRGRTPLKTRTITRRGGRLVQIEETTGKDEKITPLPDFPPPPGVPAPEDGGSRQPSE